MKSTGTIYKVDGGYALAIYSTAHDDVYLRPPISAGKDLVHVAHVGYGFQKKKRGTEKNPEDLKFGVDIRNGIDIYFSRQPIRVDDISLQRIIPAEEGHNEQLLFVDHWQDVNYELLADLKGTKTLDDILYCARMDIIRFCENPARNDLHAKTAFLKRIIPHTSLKYLDPTYYCDPDGKADFIPDCWLEANIDFSKGCVTSLHPEAETAFTHDMISGYYISKFSECIECYASFNHKVFMKTLVEIDKQRLIEELKTGNFTSKITGEKFGRNVRYLRFGKRTETAHDFLMPQFTTTLEACIESASQPIIPTRFLRHDPYVADLLKKSNASVLFSMGFKETEGWRDALGFSNEDRLETARLYKGSGVNTSLYLAMIGHLEPGERELKMLEFAEKHDIFVQLLPLRFYNTETTDALGLSWDELLHNKGQQGMFSDLNTAHYGTYRLEGMQLVLEKIHPSWLAYVEKNRGKVRMCHHTSKNTYCGTCFILKNNKGIGIDNMMKGSVLKTKDVNIEYANKFKYKKKKLNKNQLMMKFNDLPDKS